MQRKIIKNITGSICGTSRTYGTVRTCETHQDYKGNKTKLNCLVQLEQMELPEKS